MFFSAIYEKDKDVRLTKESASGSSIFPDNWLLKHDANISWSILNRLIKYLAFIPISHKLKLLSGSAVLEGSKKVLLLILAISEIFNNDISFNMRFELKEIIQLSSVSLSWLSSNIPCRTAPGTPLSTLLYTILDHKFHLSIFVFPARDKDKFS